MDLEYFSLFPPPPLAPLSQVGDTVGVAEDLDLDADSAHSNSSTLGRLGIGRSPPSGVIRGVGKDMLSGVMDSTLRHGSEFSDSVLSVVSVMVVPTADQAEVQVIRRWVTAQKDFGK